MAEKPMTGARAPRKNDIAKPLHLQRLEAALDIGPFMNYMDKILAKDQSSNSDSESESHLTEEEMCQGDKIIHGVVTTKEERRSDKLRLYNMDGTGSGLDEDRAWLRNVLLSDTGSEDSEDDGDGISEAHLARMLKDHVIKQKYSAKYYTDPDNAQYMYYGSGLLSTYDRWPSMRRGIAPSVPPAGPTSNARRRRGRGGSGGNGVGAVGGGGQGSRARATKSTPATQQSQSEDWDDGTNVSIKEEPDDDRGAYAGMNARAAARARKKAAMAKKPEVLAARRRKLWQLMGKKELGKVQRTRTAAHKDTLQNCKRMATLCTKHHRQKAMQSQKNMKETVWRCKRLTREMQSYWKRYDRVERETRRRMEKEAEEQRKMDVEMIEAKRQQRKLNFLITQTELYAHFMSRKIGRDASPSSKLRILSQLDEERTPKNMVTSDTYDVDEMKERASRNAADAFRADRARTRQFYRSVGGVLSLPDMDDNPESGVPLPLPAGEHAQPDLFRGTLKGYQLKGMNWLANLYDQGISGILADEMGLGKTVQCIAFLCHVAERLGVWGPFLVVSPASTLHNWQQEMQRFVPDFKVVPYWGNPNERKILRQFWERKDLHTREAAFHVVITSYQIVVGDVKYMNRIKWQHMILDEAQAIKSSGSQRWKLLLGFSCRNRLLLSGTPIQNSMAELWALLHFIMPTLFDSHDEFNEWFSKDIESHAENKTAIDEKHLSRLHMILKPFMLRRIKKDVENELSDKIEVMVHCPLTTRQNLLYFALKKKIKIDDLLHYSVGGESGHSVDKNFTSNLMNLVMQFRKVCNHPELFERRDVKSPLFMKSEDYVIPKMIAEDGLLNISMPSMSHLLYNKLSIFTKEYINRSLFGEVDSGDVFSFSRLINMSPEEIYRITLGDWLLVIFYMLACNEAQEKVRHRQIWWREDQILTDFIKKEKGSAVVEEFRPVYNNCYYDAVLSKHRFIICPNGNAFKYRKTDSTIWNDLLFVDSGAIEGAMYFTHTDHHIHSMVETMEHRVIRSRQASAAIIPSPMETSIVAISDLDASQILLSSPKKVGGKVLDPKSPLKKVESVTTGLQLLPEFPHWPQPEQVRPCQPTSLPPFIFSSTIKVHCGQRVAFACSRAAAHSWSRRERVAKTAASYAPPLKPPPTASCLSVPDKQTLVTDAGKLNVLDGLLKRLKAQGHRVLIYSQMTKMIDLLEEYMWHRKHKYMRLDGSSKISARRDMVADFQARSDIFVFLLSTRAGGLGINLTAADTVIFYDSDWNPTVDQQAMDRAHRLGQTKQVTVYRLICKGTIEERIMQRAREKSEIQRMVISGGNFKPDTLKPKEVVSLLLDDDEIELKYRQRADEKKGTEENKVDLLRNDKDRKRKIYGFSPKGPDGKRNRGGSGGESGPSSPAEASPALALGSHPHTPSHLHDDESNEALVVDIDSPTGSVTAVSFPSPYGSSGMIRPRRVGGRGARRGRPRGSRRAGLGRQQPSTAQQQTPQARTPSAGGSSTPAATSSAPSPSMMTASSTPQASQSSSSSVRRGPGRPRLRAGSGAQSSGRGQQRARRHRGPLLVPLGAQHSDL